jgi:hypothetical protein
VNAGGVNEAINLVSRVSNTRGSMYSPEESVSPLGLRSVRELTVSLIDPYYL